MLLPCLFDHPISSRQHIRRNRQADLLRRLQVDDELELCRLLDRKISGLGAFENLVDKNGYALVAFRAVGSIGHQTAIDNEISLSVNRRQPIFRRQLRNPLLMGSRQWGRPHGKSGALMASLNALSYLSARLTAME